MENNRVENIGIIGIGKLGLCFALNLVDAGYKVIGVDVNKEYVDSINYKTFKSEEPHVNELLLKSRYFTATLDLQKILLSDIIFITVATPSLEDGRYDHRQIENALEQLLSYGKPVEPVNLVISCTTMPEYCKSLQERLKDFNYKVSYNPEFIAQGSIIKDQLNPDMVLIGEADEEAGNMIQEIYEQLCDNLPKFSRMSVTDAEITKIALNCFLTTKISFANFIGDLINTVSGDSEKVLEAIGSDSRIGNKYLKYGYGFGGPCFPRDNRALGIYSEMKGIIPHVPKATDSANESHLRNQVKRTLETTSLTEQIKFYSVTYKKGSTIIDESQQLKFANMLVDSGYSVLIIETETVIEKVKKIYGTKFKYETV